MDAPVAALGDKLLAAGSETRKEFSASPLKWATDHLVKWGLVTTICGGLSYIISEAAARQEQAYLNDIQSRLGQQLTVSPTPPKHPPVPAAPTPDQVAIAISVGSVYNLSLSNAKVSGQKMLDAMNAMQTELDNLQANGGSPAAISGAALSVQNFNLAAQQLGYWPPGTTVTVAPTNPEDPPTSVTYQVWTYDPGKPLYWNQAEDWVWVASNSVNQVAAALLLPLPFNIPTSAPGAPPPPKPASPSGPFGWLGTVFAAPAAALTTLGTDAAIAAQDVSSFLGNVANDVQQFAGDIGGGIAYAARVVLNLPVLVWDGWGYATTWGVHTVFGDLAPWLVGAGVAMMVAGLFLGYLYPRILPRLELMANAHGARFWNRVDRKLGIKPAVKEVKTLAATETLIAETNALAEPVEAETSALLLPPAPAEASPEAPPSPPAGPVDEKTLPPPSPSVPESPTLPPAPSEAPVKAPDAANVADSPPPPPEPPVPTPTSEIEEELGEATPTLRQQKMALAARKPRERREPTAEEIQRMADSFGDGPPPSFRAVAALESEAREVGYKQGRQVWQAGADERERKLTAKIVKMEESDGEAGVEAAAEARAALEKGREEGQMSTLSKKARKPGPRVHRGFMESANREDGY